MAGAVVLAAGAAVAVAVAEVVLAAAAVLAAEDLAGNSLLRGFTIEPMKALCVERKGHYDV